MTRSDFIFENKSLKNFNTWRVGGCAEFFCAPRTLEELKEAYLWAEHEGHAVTILGDGSNVLISDQGLKGLVLVLKKLRGLNYRKEGSVLYAEVLAGTPKTDLFQLCFQHNALAAIFLSGLPGTVAGGVAMNAGVGGDVCPKEFCEIVTSFDTLLFDLKAKAIVSKTFESQDVAWSYRECRGWGGIIHTVKFKFSLSEQSNLVKERVVEAQRKRKSTQPIHQFSCGSVFKNPGMQKTAGFLIESCGLKSSRVGGAEISPLHANFIVTDKSAKAEDVYALIFRVKQEVKKQFGIELQTEVKLFGEFRS